MTFKQLKDIFTDVFDSYVVKVSRKVPMTSLYMTNKDGKFYVASVDRPQKLLGVTALKDIKSLNECECSAIAPALSNIIDVLSTLDGKLINRYFANGKNMMKCTLVCPPSECDGKCFVTFDGVDCFDNKCKCLGDDKKTGFELFKILKPNDVLSNEKSSLSPD